MRIVFIPTSITPSVSVKDEVAAEEVEEGEEKKEREREKT